MNSADFVGFGFAGFANFALAKCQQAKCLALNFALNLCLNSGFGLNLGLNSALNSNFGLNSACLALNLGFERHLRAKHLAWQDFACYLSLANSGFVGSLQSLTLNFERDFVSLMSLV